MTNQRGYPHLPSTPHPFLVAVVLGVWEAGRGPGKMARVALPYWAWGKECGSDAPAPGALAAHPLCCLLSFLPAFPSPPSGCCLEPTRFVGGCGVRVSARISVCVQGVFWGRAELAEGVWVSPQGGWCAGTRPRV